MKVHGVADEGRVVVEAEAGRALWHFALQQQLLVQLDADARLKHSPVAQAVDHDDHVVVELTNGLPADVKGLLENTSKNPHMTRRKMRGSEKEGEAERKAANHVLLLLYLSTVCLLHGAQSSDFFIARFKTDSKDSKNNNLSNKNRTTHSTK